MDNRRRRSLWFGLWLAYFLLVAVPSAQAYIDPGVGSFVFQVLVGGLLAVAMAFRSSWRKVWSFLIRRGPRGQEPDGTD